MSFSLPKELGFECPSCSCLFKVRSRYLSNQVNIACPVCEQKFFWLDCIDPTLREEIMQQIREALRELVERVRTDAKKEKEKVDEEVLRLILRRIAEER